MDIKIKRHPENPLIVPDDIKPSREGFKVEGVFNAGAALYEGEVILLLRVAESVISNETGKIHIPVVRENSGIWETTTVLLDRHQKVKKYDFTDSRFVSKIDSQGNKYTRYLTSLSHIRLARSKDGVHFRIEDKPFIYPESKYEAWGVEDPRVTRIGDWYYITCSVVSEYGVAVALFRTRDFKTHERMGIIFPPENKDVYLFPEKINGLYYACHRPVPGDIGRPNIWIASSEDLIHWGDHRLLLSADSGSRWENGKVGGGAPPFKTDKGWIHIYHAADRNNRYCLGAFMTDSMHPDKILCKTRTPLLEPETDYEKYGFFNHVVFTCGIICDDDKIRIYYGAADQRIALAEIEMGELYKAFGL